NGAIAADHVETSLHYRVGFTPSQRSSRGPSNRARQSSLRLELVNFPHNSQQEHRSWRKGHARLERKGDPSLEQRIVSAISSPREIRIMIGHSMTPSTVVQCRRLERRPRALICAQPGGLSATS